MTDEQIAEIAGKLTEAQKRALLPRAANRIDLPKVLIRWHTKPGDRYPSPRLSSLGYAVRNHLENSRGTD